MIEKKNKIGILMFVAVFAVMLLLNCLTPMVSDDFAHYYGMTGEHCTSIPEIVRDMIMFRSTTNGRVLPHFFVYLFLMMPKIVFNIVNAAMATLFVFCIYRYLDRKILLTAAAFFALWIFIPDFGQVFLWLTGSVNYLWGLVLFLMFIYPYFCTFLEKEHSFNTAALSVLGIAAGAWSENGATATIFLTAFLGLFIWIREKRLPLKLFIPFLFCLAGFAFLMTAPASTSTRAGGDILEHIWFIRVCLKDYCLWLFTAYFILLIIALATKVNKNTVTVTVFAVMVGLASIAVFAFAVYLPARSFYVLVTFLIISCALLLGNIRIKPLVPIFATALFVLFAWKFYAGTQDILNLYEQSRARENAIKSSSALNVEIESYHAETKYPAIYEEELSEDSGNWYNDLVAKYYGCESISKITK